jgi:hypothetical protein
MKYFSLTQLSKILSPLCIAFLLCFSFHSNVIALDSSSTTTSTSSGYSIDYTKVGINDSESVYYSNEANLLKSKAAQYASLVASSSSDGIDSALSAARAAGFYGPVNPYSGKFPNIKIDWGKCFNFTWRVENVPGSSIFAPKIKVYSDIVIACFGYRGDATLNAFGECKFIGLTRVCARFSDACKNGNDRCCGCTSCNCKDNDGKPIDINLCNASTPCSCSDATNGNPVSSDKCCNNSSCSCNDADGNFITNPTISNPCNPRSSTCPGCVNKQAWRICAYEDPMFPADPNDNNAKLMPFHEKSPVPPKVTGGDSIVALGLLIFAAGLLVPGLGQTTMLIGAAFMLAGGIMMLVQVITSTINYSVVANRGCIDVPLAPFPPPFCSPIQGLTPEPNSLSICHYSSEYAMNDVTKQTMLAAGLTQADVDASNFKQVSTLDKPCEIAGKVGDAAIYSTFENPIVRISFDNPLPACPIDYAAPSGTTPANDICVSIITPNSPFSIWRDSRNLLSLCDASTTNNCIKLPSGRKIGTAAPFRPYYNITNSSSLGITDDSSQNFPFGLLPIISASSTQGPSLTIAGINDAKFIDNAPGNLVTLTDFSGNTRLFLTTFNSAGDETCTYERIDSSNNSVTPTDSDLEISCMKRPLLLNQPVVTACTKDNKDSCYYSTDADLSTQPRMIFSLGNPTKTGVLAMDLYPLSGYTPSSTCDGGNPCNISQYLPPSPFCVLDDISTSPSASSASTNPAPCSLIALKFFLLISLMNAIKPLIQLTQEL